MHEQHHPSSQLTKARRAVVCDDDPVVCRIVAAVLQRCGYQEVEQTPFATEAVDLAEAIQPDLIVLDLNMPEEDGLSIIRLLKQESRVPIIMLTATASPIDRVVGLELGADDYLTKPFSLRELVARVHALVRRAERAQAMMPAETITVGDVEVDRVERRVRVRGAEVHLTPTEFELLLRLAERPGEVLDRDRLLNDVWGWADGSSATRTVDSHVRALRRKLGDGVVRTVHGVGYALDTS